MRPFYDNGGVYQLVFELREFTSIEVGKLGSVEFTPGWYTYFGSAWGTGGLRKRIARHYKTFADGKKAHWHVDYFREKANLVEAFFAHESREFEHTWATAWAELPTSTVPVRRMGASDCMGCPAHFLKLNSRPSASLLRSLTKSQSQQLIQVIEFENAAEVDSLAEWESRYWLGRSIIERSRLRLYSEGCDAPKEIALLTKNRWLREVITETVNDTGIGFDGCKEAIGIASAVETLLFNHGGLAQRVLFESDQDQSTDSILKISRKSIERQRERLELVNNGEACSIAPRPGDKAPDTMTFGKLLSRLARARGAITAGLFLIPRIRSQQTRCELDKITYHVDQYEIELRKFKSLVESLATNGETTHPVSQSKQHVARETKVTPKRLHVQLASGMSMILKNNRDIPRTSYDLRPSKEEKARMLGEINELQMLANQLATAVATCDA